MVYIDYDYYPERKDYMTDTDELLERVKKAKQETENQIAINRAEIASYIPFYIFIGVVVCIGCSLAVFLVSQIGILVSSWPWF